MLKLAIMINDESFVEFREGVRKGTLEIQKKCLTFTIFLGQPCPVYFYLGKNQNLCVTVFFFFLKNKMVL